VLATAGSLDRIASKGPGRNGVEFTASGYGLTKSSPVRVESYRSRACSLASSDVSVWKVAQTTIAGGSIQSKTGERDRRRLGVKG
jgi:hypothetical protein